MLTGLAVGGTFLWLALREADLGAALAGLAAANPLGCLVVFGTALAFMAIKSLRWRWLLEPVGHPPFQVLHQAVYVGTAANMMVAHTGELLRVTLLSRRSGIPPGAALGTVAVERVLDMVALLLIAVPLLLLDAAVLSLVGSASFAALAIVVAGGIAFADLASSRSLLRRFGTALARRLPERLASAFVGHAQQLRAGVATLGTPRRLLVAIGLSMLQWATVVLAIWVSVRAMGATVPTGVCVAVFVLTVVGLTLPSAPATLGTTQLAFVAGLALAQVPATLALAASLVYTAFFIMSVMVIGWVWWLKGASD